MTNPKRYIATPPQPGSRREKLWEFIKQSRNGFAWHEAKDAYDEGYPADANQLYDNPRRYSGMEVSRLLKEWAVRTSRGWYKMKPELVDQFGLDDALPSQNESDPSNDFGSPEIRDMAWGSTVSAYRRGVNDDYADAVAEAVRMIDEIGPAPVWSLGERMMDLRSHLVGLEDIIRNS